MESRERQPTDAASDADDRAAADSPTDERRLDSEPSHDDRDDASDGRFLDSYSPAAEELARELGGFDVEAPDETTGPSEAPEPDAAETDRDDEQDEAPAYADVGSLLHELDERAAPTTADGDPGDDAEASGAAPAADDADAPDAAPIEAGGPAAAQVVEQAAAATHGVQAALGELKGVLAALAERPQPAPVDVAPIVQAVQAGFEESNRQGFQAARVIASLGEHFDRLGARVDEGLRRSVASLAQPAPAGAAAPAVAARPRHTLALGAVALLVIGWSILFWVKTGSTRLALGTLVGANAIACCMLLARRDRG